MMLLNLQDIGFMDAVQRGYRRRDEENQRFEIEVFHSYLALP